MIWPWRSPAELARRVARREARFVEIARVAYERARGELGPQKLKPRDWEPDPPAPPTGKAAARARAGRLRAEGT
ncbi:hypothetical protein [Enterovirga aerilata]|uniref:Uncharacterized protein n=1 Tax=Enterovirga aerilata TaxID=2730920 RepID=A0A849HW56_9HYPH|nr:hypothetical protein [Enterovirga sp. DB1703]NNM71332.1 hypothetical protein [Enterovirga sp. DB1703]